LNYCCGTNTDFEHLEAAVAGSQWHALATAPTQAAGIGTKAAPDDTMRNQSEAGTVGGATEILADFPSLKAEDVQAAIAFAAASAEEDLPVPAVPRIR
jgi:hypothetical protein